MAASSIGLGAQAGGYEIRADVLNGSPQRLAVVGQVTLHSDGREFRPALFGCIKGEDRDAVARPQRFDEGIGSAADERNSRAGGAGSV